MITKALFIFAAFIVIVYASTSVPAGPVTKEDILNNGFLPYAGQKLPDDMLTLSKFNTTFATTLMGSSPYSKLSSSLKALMDPKADPAARATFCRHFPGWRKDALRHVIKEDASTASSTSKLIGLGDVVCSAGTVEKVSAAAVVISALAMLML